MTFTASFFVIDIRCTMQTVNSESPGIKIVTCYSWKYIRSSLISSGLSYDRNVRLSRVTVTLYIVHVIKRKTRHEKRKKTKKN